MQALDASSIVYAWDNYPADQFPPLWDWLEDRCRDGQLGIPQPAMDEVHHVAPECAAWLLSVGVTVLPVTNDVLQEAARIKTALGIATDQFHPSGVDENDLLIVATARSLGTRLISNEALQSALPVNPRKFKIPAVCTHHAPPPSMNFLEFLTGSGAQFGAKR